MIRYALKCPEGHSFESWFQSADAFDALAQKGLVSCAVCGGGGVSKAMMAPRVAAEQTPLDVRAKADHDVAPPASSSDTVPQTLSAHTPLSQPDHPMEKMIRAYRSLVEANTRDVGRSFAAEARAMHLGEKEEAPIRGEASFDEARSLIEDGVPILPVPGIAKDRQN
jgi:hypothetical protein